MGTYFALMDEAAKHGEDYESLDQIPEILRKVQEGTVTPDEASRAIAFLTDLDGRIATLVIQATPTEAVTERDDRVKTVKARLESLIRVIRSAQVSSSSAART